MSKSTQTLFFERLEALLPEGYSLNIDREYANTGQLRIHRTDRFEAVAALNYSFQTEYASFSVPREPGVRWPLIGDRQDGWSFPAVKFNEMEERVIRALLGTIKQEVPSNDR